MDFTYTELSEFSREHVNDMTSGRYASMLSADMFGAPTVWALYTEYFSLPIPTLVLFGPLRPVPLGLA